MRTDRLVPGQTGIKRIFSALRYSLQGFRSAFQNEEAFRQEIFASILIIPLALYFGDSGLERALLIAVWILVMVVELLNSGIEAVVDRVGAEYHALSGIAKDVGSAAVLLSLINFALVWILVLFT